MFVLGLAKVVIIKAVVEAIEAQKNVLCLKTWIHDYSLESVKTDRSSKIKAFRKTSGFFGKLVSFWAVFSPQSTLSLC